MRTFVWTCRPISTLVLFVLLICSVTAGEAAVASRPRVYLTAGKLAWLNAKRTTPTSDYSRWIAWVNSGNPNAASLALAYRLTGNTTYRDRAIAIMDYDYTTAPAVNCSWAPYDFMDNQEKWIYDIAYAFDWIYDSLDATRKANYAQYLSACAVCISNYISTSADWTPYANYLIRGMYAQYLIGLALYGDDPNASTYMSQADTVYTSRLLPTFDSSGAGKAWYSGGTPEGTGYGLSPDIELIVKYAVTKKTGEGVDLIGAVTFYQDVLKFLMHAMYPTDLKGKMFMTGDYSIDNYSGGRRTDGLDAKSVLREIMLLLIEQLSATDAAKYAQSFLAAQQYNVTIRYDEESLPDVLWYNAAQATLPLSSMPTFYHAVGTGSVFMRSGWGAGATWIGFQAGDHFAYHGHVEQGGFQISKYGQLAIKSGNYYCAPRDDCMLQYVMRTVATNSMLLYNPSETFTEVRASDTYRNDGGQRGFNPTPEPHGLTEWLASQSSYDTATMQVAEDTATHAYAKADLTNAYSSAKMALFTRELLYLRPACASAGDYVVVFDRVRSQNAAFQKKWLLHFLQEPTMSKVGGSPSSTTGLFWTAGRQVAGHVTTTDADLVQADDLHGRLFARIILPEAHTVTKIGGTGYEHWVVAEDGGVNHLPGSLGSKFLYGSWRIEVEPTTAQADDLFLNVLFPTRTGIAAMPTTQKIATTGTTMVGAHIQDAGLNRVVLFSASAAGTAPAGTIQYTFTPSSTAVNLATEHILVNLTPGQQYGLTVTPSGGDRTILLDPTGTGYTATASGRLVFTTGGSGTLCPPSNIRIQ